MGGCQEEGWRWYREGRERDGGLPGRGVEMV